ncbi:MAG TPA: biopolymer transporter ExbD [Trichococcus flocculiformis]|nr:biopolymer transporter ExbD [Trichococcus flocculiformis]
MKGWNEKPRKKGRIEIIPMIDVMMFLLVFFVLVSINVIPAQGLKTNIPKSSQSQELLAPMRAVITIGADGTHLVDGEVTDIRAIPKVLYDRKSKTKTNQKFIVILNGDDSVPLQKVIDVMDVVKGAGFDSLTIAAKKKPA